jgi:hypothetical protein
MKGALDWSFVAAGDWSGKARKELSFPNSSSKEDECQAQSQFL